MMQLLICPGNWIIDTPGYFACHDVGYQGITFSVSILLRK